MKKLILLFSLFSLISYNGKCQDTLKATAKRISSELNINPLNGSFSFNNANAQIKIRKFTSDHKALRLAITTTYLQNNSSSKSNYGYDPIKQSIYQRSLTTALNIGMEKHLNGTRRISPYIGWELGFAIKSSKEIDKDGGIKTTIDGTWWTRQAYYDGYYHYTQVTFNERGFWSVGANIVAGIDFYVAKDFYFGVEIAYGLDYYKYSKIDVL